MSCASPIKGQTPAAFADAEADAAVPLSACAALPVPAQREARPGGLCDARAAAARYKLHRAAQRKARLLLHLTHIRLTRALAISHPRPTDIAHPLSLIAADNTMNGDAPPPHTSTSADPVLASGAAPTGDLKLDTSAPTMGAGVASGHAGEASTASAAPLSAAPASAAADAAPTSPPIGTTTTTTITTTTSAAPDAASPTAGSVPGSAITGAGAPGSAIHPAAGSEAAPAPSSTLAALPAGAAAGGAAGAVAGESDKDKAAVAAPPPIAPKEAKKYDKLLKVSSCSAYRTYARAWLGDELASASFGKEGTAVC